MHLLVEVWRRWRKTAWALAGTSLLRLMSDKSWETLTDAGPWKSTSALFVVEGKPWVVDAEGKLTGAEKAEVEARIHSGKPEDRAWKQTHDEMADARKVISGMRKA